MTRSRERGFALFEVLVAFAILSLSLLSLYELWTASAKRASLNDRRAHALTIAQSVIEPQLALRASGTANTTGSTTDGFTWHLVQTPISIANPIPGFAWNQFDVTVTVDWRSDVGPETLALHSTMLARVH